MSENTSPGHENVVPLKPKAERASVIALTRLPAAMHELRGKTRKHLQICLRELFDKADDALFELADQSQSNQEQNLSKYRFCFCLSLRINPRATRNKTCISTPCGKYD